MLVAKARVARADEVGHNPVQGDVFTSGIAVVHRLERLSAIRSRYAPQLPADAAATAVHRRDRSAQGPPIRAPDEDLLS